VVYWLNLVSSKARNIFAKLLLRWSKRVIFAKSLRPNVVFLAHSDTGLIVRRVNVCLLKQFVR
jgi:hypothetical protein